MTSFLVTIEVERAVTPTKEEANEVARLVARYLRSFTYQAKVIEAKCKPASK